MGRQSNKRKRKWKSCPRTKLWEHLSHRGGTSGRQRGTFLGISFLVKCFKALIVTVSLFFRRIFSHMCRRSHRISSTTIVWRSIYPRPRMLPMPWRAEMIATMWWRIYITRWCDVQRMTAILWMTVPRMWSCREANEWSSYSQDWRDF